MRRLLTGDAIRLTAFRAEDMPAVERWFGDTGFLRHYDMIPAAPWSGRQLETLLMNYEKSEDQYAFAIRTNDDGKAIGIAGFDEILWSNRVATVFIGIGEPEYAGKGLGREAMRLLLDFGFNELNFHRIQLNVISYNDIAIRLYEGLGFVREGVCRELIARDGKRYDLLLYGMLDSEWRQRHQAGT